MAPAISRRLWAGMIAALRTLFVLPWLPLWLGPLALFGPMLMRGEVLFWGTAGLQFLPWREFALSCIRDGYVPLWNPLLGMGAPLLANHQSALLYPPNWVLALTGVAWGHGLLVLLHLVWAGTGMTLVGKRISLSPLGRAMAGLAFSLGGYVVSRAGFLSMNSALAWTPWVLWAAEGISQRASATVREWKDDAAPVATLAAVVGLQWLSGHAQTSVLTAVLAAVWVVARGGAAGGAAGILRSGARFLAGFALGCGLAGVQLVPTLEYWMQSQRAAGVARDLALTYSFWPWRAVGLLAPDMFGNPARGNFWGYGNYWEDAIYIGVLPFVLALASLMHLRRKQGDRAALIVLLWVVALGSFLLALGDNTPVYSWLFDHVAVVRAFQAPTRWSLLAVVGLALLAGVGVDGWRAPQGRGLYWARLGTAGAIAMIVTGLLAASRLPGREVTFAQALAAAGFWLAVSGVLTLVKPRMPAPQWTAVVVCVLLADLTSAGRGLNPTQPASFFAPAYESPADTEAIGRLYMPPEVEQDVKFSQTHRFDTFSPDYSWAVLTQSGLPNLSLLAEAASANNFDPFVPNRYSSWLAWLEGLPRSRRGMALELAYVGAEAVPNPGGAPGVHYEARPTQGRARLVGEVVWAADAEGSLRRSSADEVLSGRAVVLEGPPADVPVSSPAGGRVVITSSADPNRVDVHIQALSRSWLVLFDTWYPGWRVTVDGESAPIYRADYLFRAVPVPEGEHDVAFVYRPLSFYLGSAITAAAGLVLGVLLRLRRRI